jgi:triosephosphate isomerase
VKRKPLIAGNWKMNMNHLEAIALVQKIAFTLPDKYYDAVDVTVIPPFTDLRGVQTLVDADKLRITYGAQDVSAFESGAYTGEVSAPMLAKLGCTYVVVGHSERRTMHGETNEIVLAKAKAALAHGLTPIICIGEGLDIRSSGKHVQHCIDQITASVAGLSEEQLARIVVAYEPVWAIGTGKVASAADAQEVCEAVRLAIADIGNAAIAEGLRVLYGGSVTSKNVGELIAQADVDGALVGGASLKGEEFAALSAIAAGGSL